MDIINEYVNGIRQAGITEIFPDYKANQVRLESGIVLQIMDVVRFFKLKIYITEPIRTDQFITLTESFNLQIISKIPNGKVYVALCQGPYMIENLNQLRSYIGVMLDTVKYFRECISTISGITIDYAVEFQNPAMDLVVLSQHIALVKFVLKSFAPHNSNLIIVYGKRGAGKSTTLKTIFREHGFKALKLQSEAGADVPVLIKQYSGMIMQLKEIPDSVLVITPVLADYLLTTGPASFVYDPLLRLIIETSFEVPVCLISNLTNTSNAIISAYSRHFLMPGESDESLLAEILARQGIQDFIIYPDKGEELANPLHSILKNR